MTAVSANPVFAAKKLRNELAIVSALRFGAVGDDATLNDAAFTAAVAYCLANKISALRIPAGIYRISSYFPTRQAITGGALLSYSGLTIFGEGRATVIKTVTVDGADVFQLNQVSDLNVQDLAVTGVKTNPASVVQGINGVSITNGGKNIRVERVHAFDLPWVDKGAGGVDGGKGFTIQPSNAGVILDNVKILNCSTASSNGDQFTAFGFGMDVNGVQSLSSTTLAPKRVIVRGNTFECWYKGAYVSLSDNGGANCLIPSMDVVIDDNTVLGAQYGVDSSRGSGVRVTGNRLINTTTGAPTTYPTDTLRIPLKVISSYHCQFSDNRVSYAACDHFARIGGATHTTDGNTHYCSFVGNKFSGASAGNLWDLQNVGGNIAKQCVWVSNAATGYSGAELGSPLLVDATYSNLYASDVAGTITPKLGVGLTGGLQAGDAAIAALLGALGFAAADGHTVHNTIFKNGNAIAFKQSNASSAAAHVLEVQSNAGTVVGGTRNDGNLITAGALAAATVTGLVKVMPVYDAADTLIGYVPVYSTKT